MQPPPDPTAPYLTDQRREIVAWLRRNNAASLSELYQGAVELVSREVPGRVRLVAHAVREIRNRLPDILAPEQAGRLDYHARCELIRSVWQPTDSVLVGSDGTPSSTGTVTIPVAAAHQVQRLLEEDREVGGRVRAAATRLYVAVIRIRSERTLSESELLAIEPAIRQWLNVTQWFEKRVHDNGRADAENDLCEFVERFSVFEYALFSLIQEFYPATEGLNEILEEANS